MRGPWKNLYKVKLSKVSGGNIICEECNNILGSIEPMNYSYIKLAFVCKCKSIVKAELYRGNLPTLTHPNRELYNKDGEYICQNCETPIFKVNEKDIISFAFNAICKCGVEYDVKFKNKWQELD
ncbi:MAG: hypothetical protein IKC07_04385 [Clostridia bacterium]|nr:hypothetical protein [Clostridia bacterium]